MAKNGFLAAVLVCLILADASGFGASLSLSFRKLVGPAKSVDSSSTQQASPLPGPVSGSKKTDGGTDDAGNSSEATTTSSNSNPKGQNGSVSVGSPSVERKEKKTNNEKKEDKELHEPAETGETCDGKDEDKVCHDPGTLTACILSFEVAAGLNKLVVLVQNKGDSNLIVDMSPPNSAAGATKKLEIPKHHIKKINVSLSMGEGSKVVLNAGKGDCVLHMGPLVADMSVFLYLPSFDKLITPINGAYFLILTVVVFGGVLACCAFRKRRRKSEFRYQELEMGSGEGTNIETAEGWDQGWDDDWDEENAVKSPGQHHVGSISANGLTSRPANRDGWERDWDD